MRRTSAAHFLSALGLVLAPMLSSCGGNSRTNRQQGPEIITGTRVADEPIAFRLNDACQNQEAPVALSEADIFGWSGEKSKQRHVKLNGIRSAASLESTLVQQTVYDEKYWRLCDYSRGIERACIDDRQGMIPWTVTSNGQPLRLCRQKANYNRHTFESAAITSLYYLEEAHRRYNELDRGAKPLKRINLSILPRYSEIYDKVPDKKGNLYRVETVYTHNLAYDYKAQGSSQIIVFPENKPHLQAANGGFLWESAFVLAHEFGHHIDLDRNGDLLTEMGLSWNPLAHRYDDLAAERLGLLDSTDRATISGAVAEGAADLFAYYALNGSSDSLVGLPCFGASRNISNPKFADGLAKILTEDRLDQLLGRTLPADSTDGCGQVDFTDIHIGGAMLAHALDQAFAQLIASSSDIVSGSPDDFSARYKMTLQWLDEFRTQSAALENHAAVGEEVIAPVATALEVIANSWLAGASLNSDAGQTQATVKAALCTTLWRQIPVLPQGPFARNGQCD